jgi:hypothetical protein
MLTSGAKRTFEVWAPGRLTPRYTSMEVRPGHLRDAIELFEELGWEKEEIWVKSWGSFCFMHVHEHRIRLASPNSGGDPRQFSESTMTFSVSNPLVIAQTLNAWADDKGIQCTIESGANNSVIVHFISTLAFSLEFILTSAKRESYFD